MEVQTYILGPLQTNTYLLKKDGKILLIDPASKAEKIISILGDQKPEAILLTHGHFDHIKAVDGLYQEYHCPVYLHEADEAMARDKYTGSSFGLVAYISCPVEHLKEGRMKIGRTDLEGGSGREMKQSLQIFKQFDKDYDIYPGHDFPSKLSYELANNFYLI